MIISRSNRFSIGGRYRSLLIAAAVALSAASAFADIDKTTLEIAPGRFFVPYAKELRAKPPRYIRFRGFTNANCSEIELRTVRYRNSTGFVIIVR